MYLFKILFGKGRTLKSFEEPLISSFEEPLIKSCEDVTSTPNDLLLTLPNSAEEGIKRKQHREKICQATTNWYYKSECNLHMAREIGKKIAGAYKHFSQELQDDICLIIRDPDEYENKIQSLQNTFNDDELSLKNKIMPIFYIFKGQIRVIDLGEYLYNKSNSYKEIKNFLRTHQPMGPTSILNMTKQLKTYPSDTSFREQELINKTLELEKKIEELEKWGNNTLSDSDTSDSDTSDSDNDGSPPPPPPGEMDINISKSKRNLVPSNGDIFSAINRGDFKLKHVDQNSKQEGDKNQNLNLLEEIKNFNKGSLRATTEIEKNKNSSHQANPNSFLEEIKNFNRANLKKATPEIGKKKSSYQANPNSLLSELQRALSKRRQAMQEMERNNDENNDQNSSDDWNSDPENDGSAYNM